jgi:hypothetical protein
MIQQTVERLRQLITLLLSIDAFVKLTKNGFRVSFSQGKMLGLFRFYWHGQAINDMCDIDLVDGKFYTMRAGHSEKLPEGEFFK